MPEEFDLDAIFAARRAEFGNMRMDSENAGVEGGDTSQGSESDSNSGGESQNTGGNPAWNEILGSIPDSLHPVVRPALEKWDQNYRSGIEKVQSQYAPWQDVIGAADPQTVQYALAVIQEIENNPRKIYDALAEHNGWAGDQGQTGSEDENLVDEDQIDPRLLRTEQMTEAVAEYIMQQHEQQQQADEDAALDAEISQLKEQHGLTEDPLVEQFVLGLMLAGASPEDAFSSYLQMQQGIATRPRPNQTAPTVLGGGGTPSSQVTPSQIRDPKTRKNLVASLLAQANQD